MMVRSIRLSTWFVCAVFLPALVQGCAAKEPVQSPALLHNLQYEYFEGDWDRLPDFDTLTAKTKGAAPDNLVDITLAEREEFFALRFRGEFVVTQDAVYRFFMDSDDGSRLLIDGRPVIDYDGLHGVGTLKLGTVKISKGTVKFEVIVFEKTGDQALLLWTGAPGQAIQRLSRTGTSLLHYAIAQNNSELIKQLLATGANLNATDSQGMTPLHLAVRSHRTELAQQLIAAGADIHAGAKSDVTTPLGIALVPGYRGVANPTLEYLLAAVKDPNVQVGRGDYPVHVAARHGMPELLETLARRKADLDIKNAKGLTPLEVAMSHDQFEVVDFLFPRAADKRNIKTDDGQGPLHWAVGHGLSDTVASLMQDGVDVNQQNEDGETPLYVAAWNGNEAMVKVLLSGDADANLTDVSGTTPLYAAAWNNHANVIPLLAAGGAKFPSQGNTALHAAAWQGYVGSVQTLLAAGAKVNAQDADGSTPLHKAAWRAKADVVKVLLDAGADKLIKDRDGFTPADKARDAGKKAQAAAALLAE